MPTDDVETGYRVIDDGSDDVTRRAVAVVPLSEHLDAMVYDINGCRVMLSTDLATLYGVTVSALNQAVKRNPNRFPPDFMFQLTPDQAREIARHPGGRGGSRTPPYAFTEQGVAMLSSVLTSERAAYVNVEIMRVFVKLRHIAKEYADLSRRLDEVEARTNEQFREVIGVLRQLMEPPPEPQVPIGFRRDSTGDSA